MDAKYKLVPVEPSQEMLDEAAEGLYGCSRARSIEIAKEEKFDSYVHDAEKVWSAMLGLCETPLSDLEIVQKALAKKSASLNMYSDGSSSVYIDDESDQSFAGVLEVYFSDGKSLLTWAKQTIGVE